jgi:ParB family transcriptional regulator, chromosome partitioning protein
VSRKNVLAPVTPHEGPRAVFQTPQGIAAPIPAIGTIGRALGEARTNSLRVEELQKELERALSGAERVVELDPDLITPSRIRDRFEEKDSPEEARLALSIAESGQRVPILVRPNSNAPGRYIAVFGHRRLAAVKACGLRVRCIILELSDEEALVIQGQENNERKDTTFIEKAVYAWRLKASGMRSVKIAEALATSETAVSRMISIPGVVPEEVILAIGRAPSIGQPRWQALALAFGKSADRWKAIIADEGFLEAPTDERFKRLFAAVTDRSSTSHQRKEDALVSRDGTRFGSIQRTAKGGLVVTIPSAGPARPDGVTFTDWLDSHLRALANEWLDGG